MSMANKKQIYDQFRKKAFLFLFNDAFLISEKNTFATVI